MYRLFLKWRMVRHMGKWYKCTKIGASNDRGTNQQQNAIEQRDGLLKNKFLLFEAINRKFRVPISVRFSSISKLVKYDTGATTIKWNEKLESLFRDCVTSNYFTPKNKDARPIRYIISDNVGWKFHSISGFVVEFANEYKVIWFILIAIIGWSPPIREWLVNLTAPYSPWW